MNRVACTHPDPLVQFLFSKAAERGIAERELARRMGINEDAIYRFKHPDKNAKGTNGVGMTRLRKLADALGYTIILAPKEYK